jgi:hypothetical protein
VVLAVEGEQRSPVDCATVSTGEADADHVKEKLNPGELTTGDS